MGRRSRSLAMLESRPCTCRFCSNSLFYVFFTYPLSALRIRREHNRWRDVWTPASPPPTDPRRLARWQARKF